MSNRRLLKDGVWFDQGLGTVLRYIDDVVYMDDDQGQTWKVVGDQLELVSTPIRTESPAGWTIPRDGTELVDANRQVWTLSGQNVFLEGVTMGVTASYVTITNHIVKRLGLDNHIYRWTGLVWIDESVVVLTESPDGTTIPPAVKIIDSALKTWTVQAVTNLVLREGVSLGVTATVLRIVSHVVKRDDPDGHRYAWNATTSTWTDEGLIIPVILGDANGTRGQTIVDRAGITLTIDLADNKVYKNGVFHNGGTASVLVMANDEVCALGLFNRIWYADRAAGWTSLGTNDPYTGAVQATRSSNGTESDTVVFPDGLKWTRGAASPVGFQVLRGATVGAGLRMQNAECVSYLVYNDRLYWKDSTNNWWQFGGLQDGTGGMNSVSYYGTRDPRNPVIPQGGPLRYVVTTGNIALGSYILTSVPTAAYNTLLVGDCVVIEITSGMGRGSGRGPGGSFPMRSYANFAALPNPSTQPWISRLWTEDNGHVYEVRETNGDGTGTHYWFDLTNNTIINARLETLVLARSIHARIRTKNAGDLHLEDFSGNLISCQVGMTGANVYLNVIPTLAAIIDALPGGAAGYEMPAGQYPGAGVLWINRPNFILTGMGRASTQFFSPKGVNPVGISAMPGVSGGQFKGFELVNNYYPDGNRDPDWYGLNYSDGTPTLPWPTFGTFLGVNDYSDYTTRRTSTIPGAMSGYQNNDVLVDDVLTTNYPNQAFGASFCTNWITRNSKVVVDVKIYDYEGWNCGHYACTNSGMEDVEMVSYACLAGAEQFQSTGGFFRRLRLTNYNMSLNNAGGWLVEDCVQRFTADCCIPMSYHSPRQPCMNVNANAGANIAAGGGTIRRHDSRQTGYVRGGCVTKTGINVNHDCPDVRIEGAYHSAPDYNAAVESYPTDPDGSSVRYPSGSRGLEGTGRNNLVGGFACDGLSPQHYQQNSPQLANIYSLGGSTLGGFGANRGDPRTLAKWGQESVYLFGYWVP